MNCTVLIVDDSLTVRMDLDEVFRGAGCATTLCGNATAARDALARTPFSLIVLDVLLPDADGIEFLKEIKSGHATARIPVLLLSTEAEVRDRVRGFRTGADDYVGKPYDSAYLVSRARELIRRTKPPEATGPMASILLIDDSVTFLEQLKFSLESRGYQVSTAGSGEEGLRLAVDLRPRAVVVDGVLPGIDGPTVIRRLRQDVTLRRTPCLLLTASMEPGGELRALEAGADAYVRKEDGMEVILAKFVALLRMSGGPSLIEPSSSLLASKRILAVDDSLTYLHELAEHLREEGYEPILAHSGEEALELLAVQPVDCILLDLIMPGLTGHETCRRIKRSPGWRDIPVVILTAREEREAMIDGINAGADDYIAKSSDFEVLKARLRAQLRRKQFEDENRNIREELLQKELEAQQAQANRELAETRARLLSDLEKKNKELEAFSYSVSHDLRSPLRAIDGFARILVKEHSGELGAEARRLLNVVMENTQQMGRLIDDLLEFSRLGRTPMHLSEVNMRSLAQSVLRDVLATCPERRVQARIGELPGVNGDPALLRQVFANLLGNAVKYTRPREVAEVEVGARMDEGCNVYFVKDNGIGFDPEYTHKLFGVFQRLHSIEQFEGTGVGLALVHRIIERHGGQVWAEGQENEGATFYFTLPSRRGEEP